MFHVEIRMGASLVRQFNLGERELWSIFIAPLMAGRDFTYEGHDFIPIRTRITILDGPPLRPHELALGRGWQNARRQGRDVTVAVLVRARGQAAGDRTAPGAAAGGRAGTRAGAADLLRERLIGRLATGPVSAAEIAALAADLLPTGHEHERGVVAGQAVWEVLERGRAQLSPPAQQAPADDPSGR